MSVIIFLPRYTARIALQWKRNLLLFTMMMVMMMARGIVCSRRAIEVKREALAYLFNVVQMGKSRQRVCLPLA